MRVALWALLSVLVSLLTPTILLVFTPANGWIRVVAQVGLAVVVVAIASLAVSVGMARSQWQGRRRALGTPWSGIVGAPFDATAAIGLFSQTIWQLIRGA